MIELKDWISAKAAAERLGVHRNSVLAAVREGRLMGFKIDNVVFVSRDALAKYQPRPNKRRRSMELGPR